MLYIGGKNRLRHQNHCKSPRSDPHAFCSTLRCESLRCVTSVFYRALSRSFKRVVKETSLIERERETPTIQATSGSKDILTWLPNPHLAGEEKRLTTSNNLTNDFNHFNPQPQSTSHLLGKAPGTGATARRSNAKALMM